MEGAPGVFAHEVRCDVHAWEDVGTGEGERRRRGGGGVGGGEGGGEMGVCEGTEPVHFAGDEF